MRGQRIGSSSLMRKMNWSQWTQLKMRRRLSSVMTAISSKPRTSLKKPHTSVRFVSSSRSAGNDMATWLKRGFPDG